MLKRNHVSVLAMLASFSLLPFTSCSDDAGSNPVPEATESSSSVAISSSESSSNKVSSSSAQEIERPSLEKLNEKCIEQHDGVSIVAFDGVKTEYFCLGEAYGAGIKEVFSILDHTEISLYSYSGDG